MIHFLPVAEDIEWLRDEWWLGTPESLSDGHLRRGSAALALLLVDGLLGRAWNHYRPEREPTIEAPDITELAAREGLRLEHATALIAGGGREAGADIAFIGAFRVDNPKTGVPANAEIGFSVQSTAIFRDASGPSAPGDLDPLVNMSWPLSDYLDAPAAVSRGILISRRDIIDYFRHHANETEHRAMGEPGGETGHCEVISQLVGRVHSDLRDGLHFELLSIGQAIGRSGDLGKLVTLIRADEEKHDTSLRHSKRYYAPNSHAPNSPRLFIKPPSRVGSVEPEDELLPNLLGFRSPDIPVYRTFRMKHVRAMLRDGSMALVTPLSWEDPFENLIARAVIVPKNRSGTQQYNLSNIRKAVYAQCWSLGAESDALWRVYSTVDKDQTTKRNTSPDQEGLMVRTTARRLLRVLWQANPIDPIASCFLGVVRYMPQREALQQIGQEIMHSLDDKSPKGLAIAKSLLIKRAPFEQEREARIIFVEHRADSESKQLFAVPVEPNSLFSRVTVDPRLSEDDFHDRKAELRKLGMTCEIVQSTLFQEPPIEVRI